MKRWLIPLLLVLLLCGCTAQPSEYETEFFAMDTVMQLHVYGAKNAEGLAKDVIAEVNGIEGSLSVTKSGTEVFRLNGGERIAPSETLRTILDRSSGLCGRTGGCFDPTVYPVVRLWGFTTGQHHVPDADERSLALSQCGMQHVHQENGELWLDAGSALDFGAVAKGYAGELCAEKIEKSGATGILALGGNIQTVGSKPDGSDWKIGVTNPFAPDQTIAVLSLSGSHAVVTSGGYQRYFEEDGVRYSHIMDPATGQSCQSGLCSVTIVSDSGFLADGLSTALYVMGPARAEDFWRSSDDFECVLITDDGKMLVTEGLADKIETDIGFTVIKR